MKTSCDRIALGCVVALFLGSACGKKTAPPEPTPPTRASEPTRAPDAGQATVTVDASGASEDAAEEGAVGAAVMIPTTTSSAAARKAYEAGEAMYWHVRDAEAIALFDKAVELDPDFAKAKAMLGFLRPEDEAMAMLEQAARDAAELPEVEGLWIETLLAQRKGDEARWAKLNARIAELAPDDWRAFFGLGQYALFANDLDAATKAFAHAVALNPKASTAYNQLGYTYLRAGRKAESIAAFTTYRELTPDEPNPHDSLGDALLAGGRLAEAEASFRKAVEVAPTFSHAWGGVAICRALGGDWRGASEALDKLASAATTIERREAKYQRAWLQAAQGDVAGAEKTLQALEKEAEEEGDATEATNALAMRALLKLEQGRVDGVAALLDAAWARGEKASWIGAGLMATKRLCTGLRAVLAAREGRSEDVTRLLGELDTLLEAVPDNAAAKAEVARSRGMALMIGDAKAGREALRGCLAQDSLCKRHEIEALEKLGDEEGVQAAKQRLLETPWRDMTYVYVRAKLGMIPEPVK
jgi:Flp pilus assembly protein TadD